MHRFAPAEQALEPDLALGDAPAAIDARRTLRRFRQPVFAQVTVEEGRPVHVSPQGLPGGPVTQAAGPWRTSGDWWKTREGSWDRDEWDVALSNDRLYRIYCEPSRQWFVEALYD